MQIEKVEEYYKKQEIIEQHKQELEKQLEEDRKRKTIQQWEKQKKLQMTLDRNKKLESKKKHSVLDKINYQENRIKHKQEVIERNLMFKNEKENIKRKNKEHVLERLSNIQEYNNDLNKRKIEEKMTRAEDFKNQKLMFAAKKRKMAEDIAKQKNDVLTKFERLVKKSSGVTVSFNKNII